TADEIDPLKKPTKNRRRRAIGLAWPPAVPGDEGDVRRQRRRWRREASAATSRSQNGDSFTFLRLGGDAASMTRVSNGSPGAKGTGVSRSPADRLSPSRQYGTGAARAGALSAGVEAVGRRSS